jgi:hypothetical protein
MAAGFSPSNGQADKPAVIGGAVALAAARTAVNIAVDALIDQQAKDGTVSRVGVAQLRDAIDQLRQSIQRQTSKRRT